MSRLIDADALIDDCKKYLNKLNPSRDGKECTRIHWLIGILSNAPTIEPERKTGKWIELDSEEDRYDEIMCPHCRRVFTVDAYHWTDIGFTKSDLKFCPNCGAKMER